MTIAKKDIEGIVREKGWLLTDYSTLDFELISLSKMCGEIVPDNNSNIIQYLSPKENKTGIKGSFSYNYGLSSFPYHTDTAYWGTPARYVLMSSEKDSNCHTMLIDLRELFDALSRQQLQNMQKSVFTLRTINEYKFTTLLTRESNELIIRYDPNIMVPYNEYSKNSIKIIEDFIENTKPITIKWTGQNLVIFYNWKFVHSRSECRNEGERILKRIYIK